MVNIACVGDNCIDYYDATGEAFPGGNAVNVAVYVRRLGGRAAYVGAVGTDDFGALLLSALEGKGVDISRVKRLPGATALSHVSLRDGDRVFGDYAEGVMAFFAPEVDDLEFLCAHDLVVTGLWGHAEGILKDVRARGVPTAFDAADRPYDPAATAARPHSDVFFFSDDAADDAALREKLRRLHAGGPKLTVATRGGRGSLAWDGAAFYECGVTPCTVVDTMGAGDSFIAGFLKAWLEGGSVPACMKAGADHAAVTIACSGSW